jgi:secondary thiamine-phosphate synthase enzyme
LSIINEGFTMLTRILTISSSARQQLIDITREVMKFVEDSNVDDGILMVSVPHATAAVVANENERGLLSDILTRIREIFPESPGYLHNRIDDNANAHLAATFLGHSRSFPIENSRLVHGTWQSIFVVELDGPRSRREVHLNIVT